MSDIESTSSQTLAVLLGASIYRYAPKLARGPAFYNSSQQFAQYLTEMMGVPEENVASFFDESRSASDQLRDIRDFLERRSSELKNAGTPPRNLVVHYVGHGLFSGGDNDYCLAIRATDDQNEGFTSIRMRDLAAVIRHSAVFVRKYLIFDCCFSGAAYAQFQSGPLNVVQVKVNDVLGDESPQRGTSLLCSASAKDPSVAPKGIPRTMFSDSLLTVLMEGHEAFGPLLSFNDLGELVRLRIRETYGDLGVRPEVHSPDQRSGDVARVPLFPNPARSKAVAEQAEIERKRREAEERARAEAEQQRAIAEAEEKVLQEAKAEREREAARAAEREELAKGEPATEENRAGQLVQADGLLEQTGVATLAVGGSMARAVVLPAICAAVAWGTGFASMMAIFRANITSDFDLDQHYIPGFGKLLALGLIAIGGLGCSVAYRLTARAAQVKKIVLFGASFAMAFLALTLVIGQFRPALDADAGNDLELGAFAAAAGLIVAWVFQRMEPSLKVKDLFLIACFWSVSWTVAWPVLLKVVTSLNNFGPYLAWVRLPGVALPHTDVDRLSWYPARYAWGLNRGLYPSLFVWGAFLGASCSGIMFWCLHRSRRGVSAIRG